MPSIVLSFRLRCVTSSSAGSDLGLDREAVVLRGDLHAAGLLVQHRLVRPAVAELELEGLRPAGQREQLMAQADAEDRLLAQQAADRLAGRSRAARDRRGRSRGTRRRASGPALRRPWPCRAGSSRGSPCRTGAGRCSTSCRSRGRRRAARRPGAGVLDRVAASPSGLSGSFQSTGLVGNHFADQVAADQARAGLGLGHQAGVVEIDASRARPSSPRGCAAGGPGPGCRCLRGRRCRSA